MTLKAKNPTANPNVAKTMVPHIAPKIRPIANEKTKL
jgi:hypothetical protein